MGNRWISSMLKKASRSSAKHVKRAKKRHLLQSVEGQGATGEQFLWQVPPGHAALTYCSIDGLLNHKRNFHGEWCNCQDRSHTTYYICAKTSPIEYKCSCIGCTELTGEQMLQLNQQLVFVVDD